MGLPEKLSESTVETIVATAGVVAPKALDITKTFYTSMLQKYPELLAFFNPAHNVLVSIHQPSALAAAIVAYASNIKDLSPLLVPGGAVDAICQRHCALNVVPEQYSIVHQELMDAIGRVLGFAVTKPVADAWSEAVGFLARVLIDKEEALYKQTESRKGGWRGFQTFLVSDIEEVGTAIKSFSFKPVATPQVFEFEPGQYLSLKLESRFTAPRHYTVTSPPGAGFLQCTVKKIPGGVVSSYLHDSIKVGDTLQLSPPFGVFTLGANSSQAVLMSAGIGVIPCSISVKLLVGR